MLFAAIARGSASWLFRCRRLAAHSRLQQTVRYISAASEVATARRLRLSSICALTLCQRERDQNESHHQKHKQAPATNTVVCCCAVLMLYFRQFQFVRLTLTLGFLFLFAPQHARRQILVFQRRQVVVCSHSRNAPNATREQIAWLRPPRSHSLRLPHLSQQTQIVLRILNPLRQPVTTAQQRFVRTSTTGCFSSDWLCISSRAAVSASTKRSSFSARSLADECATTNRTPRSSTRKSR